MLSLELGGGPMEVFLKKQSGGLFYSPKCFSHFLAAVSAR